MGWKCPICLKDFKRDKDAWEKHCAEDHNGAGKDVVSIVTKAAETVRP